MSKVADVFDDWARKGRAEGMEQGHGKTAGRLMDVLPVGEGTHFLDLGCGNGWACRQAAQKGATAHGVDVSAEMLDRARLLGQATYHQADFAKLPFDDDMFDVVWSMEALYYSHDADAVLREITRVLKPGGVFHMLIDFYGENKASHNWPVDVGVVMDLRGEGEWLEAFSKAGFSEARSERLKATSKRAESWKRTEGTLHLIGQK